MLPHSGWTSIVATMLVRAYRKIPQTEMVPKHPFYIVLSPHPQLPQTSTLRRIIIHVPRSLFTRVPSELPPRMILQQPPISQIRLPRRRPLLLHLRAKNAPFLKLRDHKLDDVLKGARIRHMRQVEPVHVRDVDPALQFIGDGFRASDDFGLHAAEDEVLDDARLVPFEVVASGDGAGPAVDDGLDGREAGEAEVFVVGVGREVDAGPAAEQRQGSFAIAVR